MTQSTLAKPPTEDLDSFIFECEKQKRLYEELVAEGYTIADDPADLAQHIGSILEIECFCEQWTPRLLCKLFVKGTEDVEHSFHLVPLHHLVERNEVERVLYVLCALHQVVKWQYQVPQPNTNFTGRFVVGVRRVSDNQFVPALRLPLK